MVEKVEYSYITGLIKSCKNVAITVGIPLIGALINNYAEWVPKEWYPYALPIIAIVSYAIKNKVQFKG